MAHSHANTINEAKLPELLADVTKAADKPEVMRVAFMLSYYAGLRVQEIAGLEWGKNIMIDGELRGSAFPVFDANNQPVEDDDGNVVMRSVPCLYIGGDIGKYGSERNIPLHPQLAAALKHLYDSRDLDTEFVIPSGRNGAGQGLKKRAHALKMRINRMYKALGMEGFSSHSGRRTFITNGAQKANAFGNSLRDVQSLAGHKNLVTTEAYIDLSQRQADMVEGLYGGPIA